MTTNTDQVIFPCVHLSGSGMQTLLDNLACVRQALELAREQLKQAAPNGRDYYVGVHTLNAAVRQHIERIRAIDELQASLEAEMTAILAQE